MMALARWAFSLRFASAKTDGPDPAIFMARDPLSSTFSRNASNPGMKRLRKGSATESRMDRPTRPIFPEYKPATSPPTLPHWAMAACISTCLGRILRASFVETTSFGWMTAQ